MDFRNSHHVYKCVPPVLGNEASEAPVVISLRGVSMADRDKAKAAEVDAYQTYARDKAQEVITSATYELVKSRVDKIEGLTLNDKECSDFDTLYNEGPAELLQWVFAAVFSTILLSDAEVKN